MKYIINNQKTTNKNLFDKVIKEMNNKNKIECSVCFDLTNNKTDCDHDVCKNCIKKINKCPICRKNFIDKKTNKNYSPFNISLFDIVEGVQFSVNGIPIGELQLPPETFRLIQIR